jgi:hypothetical protein
MADLKKFLDQSGVSTLWTRVAEEVSKVNTKVETNIGDIQTLKGRVDALEAGTYDDTEIRGLIKDNADAITENAEAIAENAGAILILNGDAETAGSVANTATQIAASKVAEIVANADADFDTLKEIADWILNDTTGAADMANDIATLQGLVGDTAVATQIADAIATALKVDGVDKYALASDLTGLATRVETLEKAGYQNADQVGSAIDAKIAALDLANTYDAKGAAATAESLAKAYADGLAANYDAAGKADQALVDAKAYSDANLATAKTYTDTAFGQIQALTTAEIDAAIAAAKGEGN